MRLNIIAPDIWEKDAVGNFCLDLSKLLIDSGVNVSLYAQNFSKEETPNVDHIDFFFDNVKENDTIFLSYSIYDKYLERILELSNKKICYFHGVTPAHLLEEFEPITAELCRKSVEQFPLIDKFDKVLANSKFIANDLKNYISKDIEILPPVFPSRFLFNKKSLDAEKNKDFLIVGRVVPHKKVENAIKLFIEIKKEIPDANLKIIGSMPNHVYNEFLYSEIQKYGLSNSIEFKGVISDIELSELYQKSFGFINASLHEGFSIPVLEALYNGLNIFVQEGHAAEELQSDGMQLLDFNKITDIKISDLIEFHHNIKFVNNILNKNNINTWIRILNG